MSLIKNIYYKDRHYPFITIDYLIDDRVNVYSVIIGNNGTGKSRLLNHIIKEVWEESIQNFSSLFNKYDFSFNKIIAITSSPFDKFPKPTLFERALNRRTLVEQENNLYAYLGLREDNRFNWINPNGQLFKIIDSLLSSTTDSSVDLHKLSKTFLLLGYEPVLCLIYSATHSRLFDEIRYFNSIEEFIKEMPSVANKTIQRFYSRIEEDNSLFFQVKGAVEEIDYALYGRDIEIEIDIFEGNFIRGSYELFQAIQVLMDVNLINYKDLLLKSNHSGQILSFNDTSSGERALFLNILGIASQIRDNSLICIDEPEISLHPEWQEKYMRLLMSTFQDYHGCHFIIATHSPKIVSELSDTNCFILNMDENQIYSSSDYAKRSSDYQLAKLFHTPGFQNEYLLNECLELLSLISSGSKLDESIFHRIEDLTIILPKLNENDPVLKLINTLNKAMEVLKND